MCSDPHCRVGNSQTWPRWWLFHLKTLYFTSWIEIFVCTFTDYLRLFLLDVVLIIDTKSSKVERYCEDTDTLLDRRLHDLVTTVFLLHRCKCSAQNTSIDVFEGWMLRRWWCSPEPATSRQSRTGGWIGRGISWWFGQWVLGATSNILIVCNSPWTNISPAPLPSCWTCWRRQRHVRRNCKCCADQICCT